MIQFAKGKKTIATAIVGIGVAIAPVLGFEVDEQTREVALGVIVMLLGIFIRDGVKTEAEKSRGGF